MKQRLHTLWAFVKKEIIQVIRDPRMRVVLFVAPLVQLIVFGVALSNESKNITLAIWSKPNDMAINDLYHRALGTHWFIQAQTSGNDPFEWVRSGEAEVVIIPSATGTYHDQVNGLAKIQLLINAQNSTRAQSIEAYIKTIANQVFHNKQEQIYNGIKFEMRSLYNPTFETALYMVPGVLSMLVCLVTILLTSMAVAREKEMGTIETLISAPLDTVDLMLGKTVPFIILGSIQAPLILIFAKMSFGLPFRGSLWMLSTATLLMITATVAIGLLISTIAKNQQQAMLGGFMYLFPSYLLSGLMFPIENMPFYFKPFAYINPLTHYMGLLRNILLIGGNANYFIKHACILLLIAIVVALFAFSRFKKIIQN